MPLILTTPKSESLTIAKIEVTSFSVDLDRLEIHVGYYDEAADGTRLGGEKLLTIDGPGFAAAIARADEVAGAMNPVSVYGALKQALYEHIQAATGETGTVA